MNVLNVVIVDCSSSMGSKFREVNSGVNEIIDSKRNSEHNIKFTLAEFSYRELYKLVYDHVNIDDVKPYKTRTGGLTALRDAIGKTIVSTNKYVTKMGKNRRPKLVTFDIFTDGYENNSREYSQPEIKELINQRKEKGWMFNFLGEGDTFKFGQELGVESNSYASHKTQEVYQATSLRHTRMIKQAELGMEVVNTYTDDEIGMFAC